MERPEPGTIQRDVRLRRLLENRNPCDVRLDVSAAIIAGYGPRKRSPTASRRR
jgi:hypothetical protein